MQHKIKIIIGTFFIYFIFINNLNSSNLEKSCDITTRPINNGYINYTVNPTKNNQSYEKDSKECGYTCTDGYKGIICNEKPLITFEECVDIGWIRVPSSKDIYIGSKRSSSGFCISRIIGNFSTTIEGIGWNGWGKGKNTGNSDLQKLSGWNTYYLKNDITGTLDSPSGYRCLGIGYSSSDFIGEKDSIKGRMKWLHEFRNSQEKLKNIEWIKGAEQPGIGLAIPALFIADCLDGTKDLGTTMNYIHNDNSIDKITYSQYNQYYKKPSTTSANYVEIYSNTIYQNRQKYLTAWTQVSGGHLPSAFSYISNGTPGGCEATNCNAIFGNSRGEFQIACEETNDFQLLHYRRYMLSAIGSSSALGPYGPGASTNSAYRNCAGRYGTSMGAFAGTSAIQTRIVMRP